MGNQRVDMQVPVHTWTKNNAKDLETWLGFYNPSGSCYGRNCWLILTCCLIALLDLIVIPCKSSSEMATKASSTYEVHFGSLQVRSSSGEWQGCVEWSTIGKSAV